MKSNIFHIHHILNSNIFLHEQKKKILKILSPFHHRLLSFRKNHVLVFCLRNSGGTNKEEAIYSNSVFGLSFYRNFLPLQIKVSAGKLLFRLACNHLPFHYFPCPSLSRIFLLYVDRDRPSLPLPVKIPTIFPPEVVTKVVVTSLSVKFCLVTNMCILLFLSSHF